MKPTKYRVNKISIPKDIEIELDFTSYHDGKYYDRSNLKYQKGIDSQNKKNETNKMHRLWKR
ncbi:MAG: hypothetical protein ACFFG0_30290 [Candidatus Thorarchaeota archaeon]